MELGPNTTFMLNTPKRPGLARRLSPAVRRLAQRMQYLQNKQKYADSMLSATNSAASAYGDMAAYEGRGRYRRRRRATRRRGYRGRGLYTGSGKFNFWKEVKNAGRAIGRPILNAVQDRLVNTIRGSGLYTGSGAYTNTNNLIEGGTGSYDPVAGGSLKQVSGSYDETGAFCISNREYVSDVFGPGVAGGAAVAFQNSSYALNPALQNVFVWLSQIACNFEEYEFKQLIFHYRSTVSDATNNTSGQVGTVIMATNYNASLANFTDKQTMIEYAHAASCRITEHMSHGVECDPTKSALGNGIMYTRSNPVISGQDLKTYDLGKFQLAISNCPSAYNGYPIGELWVEYMCELRKPKLFSSRALDEDQDIFATSSAAQTGYVGNSPLGTTSGTPAWLYTGQQNNIGCKLTQTSSTTGTITFPATYNGPVEIAVMIIPIQAIAGAAQQVPGLIIVANSNIQTVPDLPITTGATSSYFSGPQAVGTFGISLTVQRFYVVQATQGYDNRINITWQTGNTGSVQTVIKITNFNPVLSSYGDVQRLPFVNTLGQVANP